MSVSIEEYNKLLERVSRLESFLFPMLDSSQEVINFNLPERVIPKPKSEPPPPSVDLSKAQHVVKITVGSNENYAIWHPGLDVPEKEYYYLSILNSENEERIVTAKVSRTDRFVPKDTLGMGSSHLQNYNVKWSTTQGIIEVPRDTLPLCKSICATLTKATLNNSMPLPTPENIRKHLDGIYIRSPKSFAIFAKGGGFGIVVTSEEPGIITSETAIKVVEIV